MSRYIFQINLLSLVFLFCLPLFVSAQETAPRLPLAHVYHEGVSLDDYWLSEKLDGVRAYWDGKQFLSKRGNVYQAPAWFTAGFPEHPLDGELWVGRDRFEYLLSIVRDEVPGPDWRDVSYQVFDMPMQGVQFSARIATLNAVFDGLDSPYISLVEQSKVSSHQALMERLDKVMALGGEGLMLHKGDAYYIAGRSQGLLKVKRYFDAEARVIAHLPGKGKYLGLLGSLLVETDDGKRFKLGTGFTDKQRQNPPSIGAIVTYKYFGHTVNGLPRFASFMRVRGL